MKSSYFLLILFLLLSCHRDKLIEPDREKWTTYTGKDGLAGGEGPVNYDVNVIAIDKNDVKWFGTPSGIAIYDDVDWSYIDMDDGLPANWINAIAMDEHGAAWIGTDRGVTKYDNGSYTNYDTSNGLYNLRVCAITIDSKNDKWFGSVENVMVLED